MNTSKRWFPLVVGSSLIILLLLGLLFVGPAFAQGPGGRMGGRFGSGMMGGLMGGYGPGQMMGYAQPYTGTLPYGYGMMGGGMMGGHMMGGYGYGGMMGGHMMGGMMFNRGPLFNPEPLSLTEATEAVEAYLATMNDSNLVLGEVMVFDNHAYAQIVEDALRGVEQETGIGAMEVLVDPVTKAVYPEMGPNMMWNTKYGMSKMPSGVMSGFGGYGMMEGMMGGFTPPAELSADMPVSPEEAVEIAQAYLDAYVPNNLQADEHADPFYGYYTLHINRNGETTGMLSVNGYTRQVFLHTWHGDLLDMSEEQ